MSDTFKVGELLNERSLYSKTYMNFDGSRTVEIKDEMIHFEDTEGNFHNIKTTLYDEAKMYKYTEEVEVTGAPILEQAQTQSQKDKSDGTLNFDDYDYQGLKVPFLAKLPRIFSRGYTIGDGDNKLTLTPVGSSPAKGYLNPLKDNEIAYQDAWNDADVKLELVKDGIKETIILKSEKAPKEYLFAVTEGLSDELRMGNMQLSPAWLTDANGTYRDVKQELIFDEESYAPFVKLTVDTTDLVYPILVDPTVTIKRTADGSNKVDNGISSGAPTTVSVNPAFGTIRYNDNSRFISSYPSLASTIPVGSQVTSATLNLRAINVEDSAVQMGINATAITAPYNPDTVTWNNQPQYSASLVSPTTTYTNNFTWFKINMQSLLQAIADGTPVHGFMFKYVGSGSAGGTGFALSSNTDSSNRPYLTFTYNTPPSKPTVTKPNGGEAWNSSEVITWQTANDVKEVVHDPFPYYRDSTYSESAYTGQTFTVPADNAVLKKAALRVGTMYPNRTYTMFLTRAKAKGTGGYIPDKTQILAQQNVTLQGDVSGWVEMALPNISLAKGTRLALHVEDSASLSITWYVASTNIPRDANEGNGVMSDNVVMDDFLYRLTYNEGTPANQLKYQVQLTSDNGSTWKNLSALTPAGATSLPYDFINEPASSLCKVRVRAYDGFIYGEWDESDGVFTIVHNIAPTTPTNLAPNGTIEDRAAVTRLTWKHNDPNNNDPQAKFELQWRLQGNANWTTVAQSTTNQYYDVPANVFPAGKIEWRVRTYDQGGLASPYSITALITASNRTAPPQVTYPTSGAVLPIARPTFTWSHPNQVKFWVQVKTAAGVTEYDYSTTAANKALTIDKDLSNNTNYTVNIAVMDENGLWSAFTTIPFSVSYTPPNKPVVSSENDHTNGHIKLTIETADATGTTPATQYYDVFRKGPYGDWVKISSGLDAKGVPFSKDAILTSNFVGKVSGSLVENANTYKYMGWDKIGTPPGFTAEVNQGHYDNIMTQNNVVSRTSTATVGNIAQTLLSYDVFRILENHFGKSLWNGRTTNAEKREIAIKVITYLRHQWWGRGQNGAGGNTNCHHALWQTNTNIWENINNGSGTGITRLQSSSAAPQYRIDDNGYAHIIAYNDALVAGTGTTETDYAEYEVTVSLKGTAVQWTDYTPTPNKDEMYMVRAYGVNGTYIDSDPIIATVRLQSVQIALASDPSKYVTLKKRDAGKARTGRQASTTTFVGRPYPLTEFGNDLSREYDYRYKIEDYDSVLMIQDFAQMGESFVLRDNWGKKDFVTFNSVDIEESRYFWYASLQPVKVYYVEGIL